MPTYEYRCPDCAHEFELWQRMSDEAVAACPSCGVAARRRISLPAVVFKGSGFYKTDSRAAPAAGKSSGAEDTPSKQHDAAAESTSAAQSGAGPAEGRGSGSESAPAPSATPAKAPAGGSPPATGGAGAASGPTSTPKPASPGGAHAA